jgi:hypothetical protein
MEDQTGDFFPERRYAGAPVAEQDREMAASGGLTLSIEASYSSKEGVNRAGESSTNDAADTDAFWKAWT